MIVPLPIDAVLPEIVARVRDRRAVVLVAEAGAGKTTRVPPALLRGLPGVGEVVVSEPRRLAARLAAHRVAAELGAALGALVGYQVRLEDRTSEATRLRYVTEGVLLRQLAASPTLPGVGAVVLDEFHERHLQGDVALALLRRLQRSERPELAIVAMSATLEAEPVAQFLGCDVVRVAGRQYPIEVEHQAGPDDRPLETRVAGALRRVRARGVAGDVLVFLPGAAEIRRARDACAAWAEQSGVDLVMLHGDQPLEDQVRAVAPSTRPKAILSTNVAETSITIEGVGAVIDTGLARVARHSPWSGLQGVAVVPISQAAAEQRAGRAGRTGPGLCLRLYTEADLRARRRQEAPEIARADLTEIVLLLRAAGLGDLTAGELELLEAPPPAALEAAGALLRRLGAVTASGEVTALGREMAALPLHPRLARLAIEARERGAGRRGALLAALLQERDVRLEARADLRPGRAGGRDEVGPSDCLDRLEAYEAVERLGIDRDRARAHGLDLAALRAVRAAARQLASALGEARRDRRASPGTGSDEALLLAVLAGFPDRVGRRRRPRSDEVVFAAGGAGRLLPGSVVSEAEYLVAVEAQERARGQVGIRVASAIEPDWLLDLFPDHVVERREVRFDAAAERVEAVETLAYDGLVLDESISHDVDPGAAAPVLARAALEAGVARLWDAEAIERLRARVDFAAAHVAGFHSPPLDDAAVAEAVEALCAGRRSFAELRRASLADALLSRLPAAQAARLAAGAPETVSIPGRARVPVRYERGAPPSIASRLQDFFGATAGPAIAGGAVPLVLHLLAPSQRPVQVTTDLAGFWDRHYPSIRSQLMRRYPRHAWPEDPRTASPPRRQ